MNPYRTPPPAAPTRLFAPRIFFPVAIVSALAGALTASVPACTPAERQDAALVLGGIAAVASSPVPCLITKVAASGSSATLCGQVSSDVSQVAKIVEEVLAAQPAAPPGEAAPPVHLRVRGPSGSEVEVLLPASAAEAFAARVEGLAGKDGGA